MKHVLAMLIPFVMFLDLTGAMNAAGADFKEKRLTDRVLILKHAPWEEIMTVIDTGSSLLVVDTWGSLAAAKSAKIHIDSVFHKPVRYVINTHHHWDHTFGNAAFPGAEIIGHRFCAEDMIADYGKADVRKSYFKGNVENESLRTYILNTAKELENPEFRLVPPTRLTEERDTIRIGDLSVLIYHTPGIHTRSNITIFIPEMGILFGRRAFADIENLKLEKGADPLIIARVLEEILSSKKPVRYLIPGHYDPVENPDLKPAVEQLKRMQ